PEIDVFLDVATGANRRISFAVRDDVEIVKARSAAQAAKQRRVRPAGQFCGGRCKLCDLQCGKFAQAAIEDEARQYFVLRQFGLRGKPDVEGGDASHHGDEHGDVRALRAGDEVEIGVE